VRRSIASASAPGLLRHTKDQRDDFILSTRAAWLALVDVIPFLCDQFSVPGQEGVWRNQRIELSENLTAE
jgi:hypothetical protein